MSEDIEFSVLMSPQGESKLCVHSIQNMCNSVSYISYVLYIIYNLII